MSGPRRRKAPVGCPRHEKKASCTGGGSSKKAIFWLPFFAQKPLQDGLDASGLQRQLTGRQEPSPRVLVLMPPDQIGRGRDRRGAFAGEAPLHIGPTEVDHGDPLVHRLVGLQAKIGQSQPDLEVPVGHLAGPPLLIGLKALLSCQRQIRTEKVRRGVLPGMPFGNPDTDVEGRLFETALQRTDPVGRRFGVCSGQANLGIPLVLEGAGVMVEAEAVEFAIVLKGAHRMPTLTADELDQPRRSIPRVDQDIDRPSFR